MGCDKLFDRVVKRHRGFNPRTHMGCDEIARKLTDEICVSIHAPTWGATGVRGLLGVSAVVSIRAPTWGATAVKY